MMNYGEFCKYTEENIKKCIGEKYKDCDINLYYARKNNNVTRVGLTIKSPDSAIAPTIYLEEFYQQLLDGESLETIYEEIMNIYDYAMESQPDISVLEKLELEKLKDHIAMRMVNYKNNRELLSNVPHTRVDDLAVYYVIVVGCDKAGCSSVTIKNENQEMMNISTEELHQIAMGNTKNIFPPQLIRMEDKFSSSANNLLNSEYIEYESEMYVLTNQFGQYGAVNIMYPDIAEKVKEIIGGDYYILPANVHDLVLVPKDNDYDAKLLGMMVREVNEGILDKEDYLSDHIYEIDFDKHELRTVKESLPRQKEMER